MGWQHCFAQQASLCREAHARSSRRSAPIRRAIARLVDANYLGRLNGLKAEAGQVREAESP